VIEVQRMAILECSSIDKHTELAVCGEINILINSLACDQY